MGEEAAAHQRHNRSANMIPTRLTVLIALLAVLVALPEPGTIPGPLVRTNLHTPNTTDLDTPL